MRNTWFVTGTDTEVGKTAVSCALLRAARSAGLKTVAIKPVAAGCDAAGRNEDALALLENMTEQLSYEQVNPVALSEAIAPHIAARREGRTVRVGQLAGLCRGAVSGGAEFVLIEGAGGWRVPVGPRETLADLARELQVPVIIVVAMRLGCLNHALLTAEAVRRDGLPLAGWVANQPAAQPMSCYRENLDTLKALLPAPLLGEIPYLQPWSAEDAEKYINIQSLIGK